MNPPRPATSAPEQLAQSRRYCMDLPRRAAKNFYYGLRLLPPPKRAAMFALYAYMRRVDDIADAEDGRTIEQRLADLAAWRKQTHDALANGQVAPASPSLWPAFVEMMRTYAVPIGLLDDMIAGQEQDMHPLEFNSFDELRLYCYRVAGVVGLASIHIWGFSGQKETEELAIRRGIAFQLTNILRDLREDSARGRCYLPRSELAEAGVQVDDLHHARGGESFNAMMKFQAQRADSFYQSSADLEQRISPDSRPTLATMTQIYRALLAKIAADPQQVLQRRVSLSLFSKLRIGWQAARAKHS